MSLLLAADDVVLYPPSTDMDEHGWRLPDEATSYWTGVGNLQLGPGLSNPLAASGGGRGPYGPARDDVGNLFLPSDVALLEGSTAVVRGRSYVLSQVRLVADPAEGLEGPLTCWTATATSVDSWPAGGTRNVREAEV